MVLTKADARQLSFTFTSQRGSFCLDMPTHLVLISTKPVWLTTSSILILLSVKRKSSITQ